MVHQVHPDTGRPTGPVDVDVAMEARAILLAGAGSARRRSGGTMGR